jgi:hypothetical protein
VFFSSAEALVAQDVNGRSDAYEYDVGAGSVRLLSSGTSGSDSWFLDASADGEDAFFVTRERLVGWDRDDQYDVYDARVGGGFPEPPPVALACAGDACQGDAPGPRAALSRGSAAFTGAGDAPEQFKPRPKQCRRGFVKKRVRGKRRCVMVKRRGRAPNHAVQARSEGRGS